MVNLRICNNGSAEWGVFPLCVGAGSNGVLLFCYCLKGYVTAIISFWVSLSSSSIPPYVIFQLASRLRSLLRLFAFTSSIFHIFFLVVDSSACVRSRLQFFTASAELLTKLCRNVENVVNVKRKIVLRKQVRNTRRKKENYIVAENVRKPQERERS